MFLDGLRWPKMVLDHLGMVLKVVAIADACYHTIVMRLISDTGSAKK